MKILHIIALLILHTFNSLNIKASFSDDTNIESKGKVNISLPSSPTDLSINSIPHELLYSTFALLDVKSLLALESVSRSFSSIAKDVWKDQVKEINLSKSTVDLEIIHKFVKDSHPFRSLKISKPGINKTNLPPETFDLLSTKASLEKLDISGNILYTDQLAHLSKLTNLMSLSMNRTIILDYDAEALEGISQLTKLTHLEINANQLNPKALQHLTNHTNLRYLDVSYNFALDDTSIPNLQSLKNLETLNISHTSFTNTALKQLNVNNIIMTQKSQ
jgi:hypothetical protein